MGFVKYIAIILCLNPWLIQGQAITYPQDSTALVYVIQGHARASAAYFESGLPIKAQQIEAERTIERQHVVYTLTSEFFDALPVYFIHEEDVELLQKDIRKGIFLDTSFQLQNDLVCQVKYILLAEIGPVYGSQLADPYHDGKTSTTTQTPQIQEAFVLKDIEGNQLHDLMPSFAAIRSISKKRLQDWSLFYEEGGYKVDSLIFQYPSNHLLFARPDKIEQADLAIERMRQGKLNECHPIAKAIIRLNASLATYYNPTD